MLVFVLATNLAAQMAATASAPAQPTLRVPAFLPVTGLDQPELAPLDAMMKQFLAEQKIPGAALAVAKDGKLLYARGFGYSDLELRKPVEPNALFRIASISKTITAAAVLQLAEDASLHIDDKAFFLLRIPPGGSLDAPKADVRLATITLKHLLTHTAGWDSTKSPDPMFHQVEIAKAMVYPPPPSPLQIIQYMAMQRLDFDPGLKMVYSNFGYCMLGRVVEKASRKKYEDYVKRRVLEPLGIVDMRLGKSLLENRAPGEVKYYDLYEREGHSVFAETLSQSVPLPYGSFCLESMDSHGGWIASAVDLVRFASAFDKPNECKILDSASIKLMFERPDGQAGYEVNGDPKPTYYGCGWMIRPVKPGQINAWHTGSLPGSYSLLVRRHDGFCWAVLFNARTDKVGSIDPLIHKAIDAVKKWPDNDQLPKFLGTNP